MELTLQGNLIDDDCIIPMAEYIQSSNSLEILHLSNNFVGDKGIELLSKELAGNTSLKELNLHGNTKITNNSLPCLIELINKTGITYIDITMTGISDDKQYDLVQFLQIPLDQREIPVPSNSKSAAKS